MSVEVYIWLAANVDAVKSSRKLMVPNVTVHQSLTSVPVTVLLYNSLLLCGFSAATDFTALTVTCTSLSVPGWLHQNLPVSCFLPARVANQYTTTSQTQRHHGDTVTTTDNRYRESRPYHEEPLFSCFLLLSFVAPLVCFCCSLHSTPLITWPIY